MNGTASDDESGSTAAAAAAAKDKGMSDSSKPVSNPLHAESSAATALCAPASSSRMASLTSTPTLTAQGGSPIRDIEAQATETSSLQSDSDTSDDDENEGGGVATVLNNTVNVDVHTAGLASERVSAIHDNAEKFSEATEYGFTFLQVFSAAVSALALGA